MPETLSVRPTSQSLCRDSYEDDANIAVTMPTIRRKTYTHRSPPKVPPPRFPHPVQPTTTATVVDAYNRGMLLSHFASMPSMFSWCGTDTTSSDTDNDYGRNWSGHQPLMPSTWSGPALAVSEEASSKFSPVELRYMRRRKRRGIMPSPAASSRWNNASEDDHRFSTIRVGTNHCKDSVANESKT